MSMGDRIAVMNAGRIEQVDPPEVIYHDPNSLFVADFIGSPEINFFESAFDGTDTVDTGPFDFEVPDEIAEALDRDLDGEDVIVGVRPEDINLTEPGEGLIDTEIQVLEPMGDTQILYFDVGDERIRAVVPSAQPLDEDDTVGLTVNWENVHFFRPDGPKVVKWRNVTDERVESEHAVRADGTGSNQ